MFEAGYLIPEQAERLASPTPDPTSNSSAYTTLLGSILRRQLASPNASVLSAASGQFQGSGIHSLLVALCILSVCTILVCLGPLIQTILSFSHCNRRRKRSHHPRHPHITFGLVGFICTWLLVGASLISFVIFLSEHLNFARSRESSFVDRVDDVANRTFNLLRILTQETVPLVNNTINGLMNDFYVSVLDEVPMITNQFLKLTDLDTPLAMLGNLAKTVEDMLNAHIYLRENGPQVALELGKLDSNIRVNGEMLLNEFQQTQEACSAAIEHLPSLEAFGGAIKELPQGLYDNQNKLETFFTLFRLESSLGLFNMLNVLPFNVSEVTDQLRSAIKVRGELEESIRFKTERWFGRLSNQTDYELKWLSPYTDQINNMIDSTDEWYRDAVGEARPAVRQLERTWTVVYFLGALVLATPTVLLICSCIQPRRTASKTPVKEVFPLMPSSEAASTVSSGRGSSDDGGSSVVSAPTRTRRLAPSPTFSSGLASLDGHAGEELLGRNRTRSIGSDSGCPRNDSRLAKVVSTVS